MIFYIDKLIQNVPDRNNGEDAIGFADDICHISIRDNLEKAARRTEDFMNHIGGGLK
jgi:hypothetical protein